MRCLGILVQAPIPGRVKRRLETAVGPSAATEVHWRIGRRVVSQALGPGYRTTIWFAPASEGAFVREWLDGLGRFESRPQLGRTLGERLACVLAHHFGERAQRVILLAGDCPGVDRHLITTAFAALSMSDVVLGPTPGGGCYLLGLARPQPGLLGGLRDAAGAPPPLPQLRARARGLGLRVRLLRPLREVRTLQDAQVLGLLPSRSTIDGTSA